MKPFDTIQGTRLKRSDQSSKSPSLLSRPEGPYRKLERLKMLERLERPPLKRCQMRLLIEGVRIATTLDLTLRSPLKRSEPLEHLEQSSKSPSVLSRPKGLYRRAGTLESG